MNNLRNNFKSKPSRLHLILSTLDDMQNHTAKLRNDISRKYREHKLNSLINSARKLTSNNPYGHTL